MRVNPELTKESIRKVLFEAVSVDYDISSTFFDKVWGQVLATGIVDKIIEKKAEKILPSFSEYSLKELEAMVSDDLTKNNLLALEMIKRPNFNRELVNTIYNGLGVSVKMGAEGTYGKGIMLKRALNLQQFYTASEVSLIMKRMMAIGEFARVYDPTAGSGRLFWHMPNQKLCHGIEIEGDAYRIARALYPDAQIIQDNTMLHMHENTFDYVVANPPFTLFWEDEQRIFKFTGYNNRIVSEIAVIESSIRSLHDNGYLAIIMPTEVWITKFMDKVKFVDWMKAEVDCIAKIELPAHTHEGTVWPTALFMFKKTGTYRKGGWPSDYGKKKAGSNLPNWQFTYKLASYEPDQIEAMVKEFMNSDMWGPIMGFADQIENQGAYIMKVEKVKKLTQTEYLRSATEIKSDDKVELDAKLTELDTFVLPPITLIPNGLHADLKVNAIKAKYGVQWSPSRRSYVDLFKDVASLDGFLDERRKYDDLPLINNLHTYDNVVTHSKDFTGALAKRKEWVDFQNTPLEIWVDEKSDMNWQKIFDGQGYQTQYPAIWKKWQNKFDALQNDPQYDVFLPMLNYKDNWMKHLFEFQKNDVLRLAMKASVINASGMGLGKTRCAIATALLKGFDNNLIVCQTRLINTWEEEFRELGLEAPYHVEYSNDLKDMMNHQFVIVSYETLRSPRDKPRPKSKRKRSNPAIDNGFSYDIPSVLQTEEDMTDMMQSMGFSEDVADYIVAPLPKTKYVMNPKKGEGEQTKAQEQQRKLQTMPLFADHFSDKFGYMIVDEAHNLSNPTTLQTQAVWRLRPKHICYMTGTPIKNRVKGLLSLLIIGWGEDTTAMPYTKQSFLEHFMQKISVEYEVADAHGYISKKEKEVEIPQIANPDDLRTLMAGKWLRRSKYEPEVAQDRKFPKPHINFVTLEPSDAERAYSKQWYDELQRLKQEIAEAKEQLKALRDDRKSGWGWSDEKADELSEIEKELRVKVAIFVIMIGKLRAVALAPQINWLGKQTTDEVSEEEYKTPLTQIIHIEEPYRGGITPRQQHVLDELKRRVKLGEQCYTIVDFPAFNRQILKPLLDKAGIKSEVIDGSVSKNRRNEIINKFREKKVDILLATIGTFDVGINIPSASYCAIIMPNWNWSSISQSFNRMIRPQSVGERTVDIFILNHTIENYVEQLNSMKRFNQEYVIDYGPRPPEQEWFKWTDAVGAMFVSMEKGEFSV